MIQRQENAKESDFCLEPSFPCSSEAPTPFQFSEETSCPSEMLLPLEHPCLWLSPCLSQSKHLLLWFINSKMPIFHILIFLKWGRLTPFIRSYSCRQPGGSHGPVVWQHPAGSSWDDQTASKPPGIIESQILCNVIVCLNICFLYWMRSYRVINHAFLIHHYSSNPHS